MFDYDELRKAMDRIENNKNKRQVNFATKYLAT